MTADAQFATSDLRSTLSKFEARAEEAGIEGKEAAKVRREGERERERERGGFFVFSRILQKRSPPLFFSLIMFP